MVQIISCASPNSFLTLEIGDEALSKSAKKRQKAPFAAMKRDGPKSALERDRQHILFSVVDGVRSVFRFKEGVLEVPGWTCWPGHTGRRRAGTG